MKRFAPLVLFLLVFGCTTAAPPEGPVHVVLVGTTDVHGWFNGHVETPQPGEAGVLWGGLPTLASYVNALRAQHPGRVILVDSGDMFQGTLESNLFEGAPVIRGYNFLGYSAAAVGNHEFDFGPLGPDAIARKPGDDPLGALKHNASMARFAFLSANMKEKATGQTPAWAKRFTIVEAGGAKVGIIGLSTPDTPNVTMTANVLTLDFTDPLAATLETARELRAAGADAVVVIAHIGGRCTKDNDPHDLATCDRHQEAMEFLNGVPPGTIDAYFGGHTHAQMRHFVNGIPVAQALPYSREFSTMDLFIDTKSKRVLADRTEIRPHTMICSFVYEGTDECDPRNAPKGAKLVPRTFQSKPMEPNARVAMAIEPYLRRVAAKRNERLGIRTAAPFTRQYSAESELGNLIADALREGTGADFAFMNSGGIRAELRQGDLVYSDMFEVSPFDNYPAVVTMTGAQVVESLQATTGGARGIMQVSGLKYTYDAAKDADKPMNERRRLVSVTLADGSPLDPQKLYTIAMPDFVAAGGDGMVEVMKGVPAERVQINYARAIREVVIEALRKRGTAPLVPRLEGRITVLNAARPQSKS